MFTGIVEAVGKIRSVTPQGQDKNAGVRLEIDAGDLPMEKIRVGDSVAINGACMTVVERTDNRFKVDVSRESLDRTTGLDKVHEVNLEKALALGDMLGGHLVSGHVDGVGTVRRFAPVAESWELVVEAPAVLGKFLAYTGSVAVDGVSLTVNKVQDTETGCLFSINLIPHTVDVTTLRNLAEGSEVNLEIDLIARYVERMLTAGKISPDSGR